MVADLPLDFIVGKAAAGTDQAKKIRQLKKSLYFERLLQASCPVLKPTHPVCQDINELLHRELDPHRKTRAHVIHQSQRNAFLFLHGSLYITTGLCNLIDTEDELLWLLGHELGHYKDPRKWKELEQAKTWQQYLAAQRIEEWASDITSFLRMNRAGRNPAAAKSLLEKLSRGERSGGLVHGDTTHRLINLHWVTRLMDLKGLDAPMTPYHIDTSRIKPEDYIRTVPNLEVLADPTADIDAIAQELAKCDAHSAIAAYSRVMETKEHFQVGLTGRSNLSLVTSRLFDIIEQAAYQAVKGRQGAEEKAAALAELVSILCCGRKPESSYQDEDLQLFLDVLEPKYFESLDIVPTFEYGPVTLLKALGPNLRKGRLKKRFLPRFGQKLEQVMDGLPKAASAELELAKSAHRVLRTREGDEEDDSELFYTSIPRTYARRLYRLSLQDAMKLLYDLKAAFIARRQESADSKVVRDAYTDVDNDYAKWIKMQFRIRADREPLRVKELAEGIKACRALDVDPLELSSGAPDDLTSMAHYRLLIQALKDDNVVRKAYPFAQPSAVASSDKFANDLRVKLLQETWKKKKDIGQLLRVLRESLRIYPRTQTTWDMDALLEDVISQLKPDASSIKDRESLYLLSLCALPVTRDFVQSRVLPPLFEKMDFKELYDFVTAGIGRITTMQPIEKLVEEKAQTIPQLQKLVSTQQALAKLVTEQPDPDIGIGNALGYASKCSTLDRLTFLKCALNTQYGERELKTAIYRSWRDLSYTERVRLNFELMGTVESFLDTQTLYLLDLKYKYMVLRTALADATHGVLVRAASKRRLAPTLMQELVAADNPQDKAAVDLVEKLLSALVEHAPLSLSYFTLVPLMMNKLFLPPPEHEDGFAIAVDYELDQIQFPKDKAVRQEAYKALAKAIEIDQKAVWFWPKSAEEIADLRRSISAHAVNDFIARTRNAGLEEWFMLAKKHDVQKTTAASIANVLRSGFSRQYLLEKVRFKNPLGYFETRKSNVPGNVTKFFGGMPQPPERRKMRPLEFIVETARNMGSPGVRFLQLLGQYANIPKDYQQDFQQVYDNVRGQSKLTAFQTVAREWPDIDQHLSRIEDAVGGGSLTTVYRARWKDGTPVALKVLNPNLKYFNNIAFEVIKKTLDNLSQTDSRYRIGLEVLDDIRRWIEGDIDFTGFLPKDREFRERNHGFAGPGKYRIIVPRSYRPESKYFKLEEFIEGTNLTQHEELVKQGHNLKAIVSTICNNYMHQLQKRRVHADVHPGNFRVTKDREIAILDRNFYLDFGEDEQARFMTALGYAMAGNVNGLAAYVVDYLATGNGNMTRDKNALKSDLVQVFREGMASAKPLPDRLLDVVRAVRTSGYTLPLNITLLVRNLHALQKFSERAGFASVEESLAYRG